MAADKPTVHLTLAKLKEETSKAPDPYRVGLSGGKLITFIDYYGDMDSEKSEELLATMNRQTPAVWPVLDKWLSVEDAKKLRAEKFNLRQLMKIMSAAQAHFEKFYGDLGEGGGSDD